MINSNVIIIGAPRSGTNMLRDILANFQGFATWPCDEINYIWRHGNSRFPSDEIPQDLANDFIREYINQQFSIIRKKYNAEVVIEKTCANCLRIPFVNSVLPDAKYIFIYRDGIDVAGSASLRWKAKLDFSYLFEKLKYVPMSDIPYYSFSYIGRRLYKIFSKENRLSIWGPRIKDMNILLNKYNLNELCALQWERCMNLSEEAFNDIPDSKIFRIRYEDLVTDPFKYINQILKFLDKEVSQDQVRLAVSSVSSNNIGKGRKLLGNKLVKDLEKIIEPTLKRYDYK